MERRKRKESEKEYSSDKRNLEEDDYLQAKKVEKNLTKD
jgi:hypothetical protein